MGRKDAQEDLEDQLSDQQEATEQYIQDQQEYARQQAELANQKQAYAETRAQVAGDAQGSALKSLNREVPVSFTDIEEKDPNSLLY
jgi:hypothetical protein